jgi:hypothetical protein
MHGLCFVRKPQKLHLNGVYVYWPWIGIFKCSNSDDRFIVGRSVQNCEPKCVAVLCWNQNLLMPSWCAFLDIQENVRGWKIRPPQRKSFTRRLTPKSIITWTGYDDIRLFRVLICESNHMFHIRSLLQLAEPCGPLSSSVVGAHQWCPAKAEHLFHTAAPFVSKRLNGSLCLNKLNLLQSATSHLVTGWKKCTLVKSISLNFFRFLTYLNQTESMVIKWQNQTNHVVEWKRK